MESSDRVGRFTSPRPNENFSGPCWAEMIQGNTPTTNTKEYFRFVNSPLKERGIAFVNDKKIKYKDVKAGRIHICQL